MSPALASLKTLVVNHDRNGGMVADSVIVEALQSPLRQHIETLAVSVNSQWRGPSVEVMESMAGSPYLRKLRTVVWSDLANRGNGPQDAPALLTRFGQSPNFTNLRAVNLRGCMFTASSWNAVLRWPFLPRLDHLWMATATLRIGRNTHGGVLSALPKWRDRFDTINSKIDWVTWFSGPRMTNDFWLQSPEQAEQNFGTRTPCDSFWHRGLRWQSYERYAPRR